MTRSRPLLILLGVTLWLLPARASTVLPLTLSELCAQAQVIQRCRVLSMKSAWGEHLGNESIVTTIQFESVTALAGEARQSLVVAGGRVGEDRQVLTGQPELKPGEEVLIFLHGRETHTPYLGFWRGVFRLRADGTFNETRGVLDVDREGKLSWVVDNEPALLPDDFVAEVERLRDEIDQRRARLAKLEEAR